MKVYYIGTALEEYREEGTRWTLEGVFSTLEKALDVLVMDEFIVEVELDHKYPKSLEEPDVYWWLNEEGLFDHHGHIVDRKGDK